MSFLRNIVERRSSEGFGPLLSQAAIPPPGWNFPTDAGRTVNVDSAMRQSAVFACVSLLTSISADLRFDAMRRRPDGTEVPISPPNLLVHPSTEPSISAADWRGQIVRSWLLRGNSFGLVREVGPAGEPQKIKMIHPDYVSVLRVGDAVNGVFEFRVLGQKHDLWPLGDLWHVPGLHVIPGSPAGISIIDYGRQSIGLGLAAESYAAKYFGDSAIPTGLLKSDQALTAEQAQVMKQRWNESVQGNRGVAVLGQGVSFDAISPTPEQSMFLDTIKANATTIARWFGVPPELIGAESGSSLTYSTLESRMMHLLILSARPLITKLESALSDLLRGSVNVRANTDDLLRTDARTRADIQTQRIRTGMLSVNEARAQDGLPPLPGDDGDRYLWPPFAAKEDATQPTAANPNDAETPPNV